MVRVSGLFSGEVVEASAPRRMVNGEHYTLNYDASTNELVFILLQAPQSGHGIGSFAIRPIRLRDADIVIPSAGPFPWRSEFSPVSHPRAWRGHEGDAAWTAELLVGARDITGVVGRMEPTTVPINATDTFTIPNSKWSFVEERAGLPEGRVTISVSPDVTPPDGMEIRAAAFPAPYTPDNYAAFHNLVDSPEVTPGVPVTIESESSKGTVLSILLLLRDPAENTWLRASESVVRYTLLGAIDTSLPSFVSGPTVSGANTIGSTLSVAWVANNATGSSVQWTRNGINITGQTGTTYLLVAADDLQNLRARVTLTNANGSLAGNSNAIQAVYAAPIATGSISDIVEDQEAGASISADASGQFDATPGSYTVSPTGSAVTIDTITGRYAVSLNSVLAETQFTIRKTNSGGSASLTFNVTIEASDPVIVWPTPEPVQSDVTVTEVTDPDEAAAAGFPGVDGNLKITTSAFSNFAPTGFTARIMPFNPQGVGTALTASTIFYTTGGQARGAVVTPTVQWQYTATGQRKLIFDKPSIKIQGLDDDDPLPPGDFPLFPAGVITQAKTATLTAFNTSDISAGVNAVHSMVAVAYNSWAGDRSCDARTITQLRNWCGNGNGSKCPCGTSGYSTKYEVHVLAVICFARGTPQVWNALDSVERTRLDLIAKMLILTACAISSDKAPRNDTLIGRPSNKGGNINFSLSYPAATTLGVCYFGGQTPLLAFLESFNKTSFRSACASAGLTNITTVLDQWVWTTAQVTTALTSPTIRGFNYGQVMNIMTANDGIPRAFPHQVRPGGGANGQGVVFNGETRGIIMSGAGALPNIGQVGMCQELNGTDASEGPSTSNLRSSMTYTVPGTAMVFTWMMSAMAHGLLVHNNSILQNTIKPRATIGITDLAYKNQQGYKNFAHGGQGTGNGDWTAADDGQLRQIAVVLSMWEDVLAPWLGDSP